MEKTLLQITQDILNDLDGDPVNTISGTVESLQVANIIRTVYEEMLSTRNWPHTKTVEQFSTLSDTDTPTKMTIPDNCKEIITVYYNKRKLGEARDRYTEIPWMEPEEFLAMLNRRDNTQSNVQTVTDYELTKLYIYNDRHPKYWTSFDDTFIYMDSFDAALDSTLQNSKTQVIMYKEPSFTFEDTFVPVLPSEAFPNLIAEAKSRASVTLRQVEDGKAEQVARRTNAWLSRKAWTTSGGIRRPDYGRKNAGRTA